MKRIALRTYGKIIAFLLSLYGFLPGCNIGSDPVVVEYGVPSADFKVKGMVESAVTGEAISNIRVILKEPISLKADTTFTDASGAYSMEAKHIFGFPVTLYADDVDGEANGMFSSDSMVVRWDDVTRIKKGDDRWYDGVFEKNDAHFSLKDAPALPLYGVRPEGETD